MVSFTRTLCTVPETSPSLQLAKKSVVAGDHLTQKSMCAILVQLEKQNILDFPPVVRQIPWRAEQKAMKNHKPGGCQS